MDNTKRNNKEIGEKLFDFFVNNKAMVILIIIAIGLTIASPLFATPMNLVNILRQCSYTIVMGVGFTLILATGNMDLSVGYMLGFLGCASALISKTDMPAVAVILITLGMGALFGYLNGILGTVLKIPLFIATLGMQQIFRGLSQLITHNKNVTVLPDWYRAIGQESIGIVPISIFIMIVVAIIGIFIVRYTKFGRHILAVGGNVAAAKACGINANSIIRKTYMLMGVCAALAALILTGRASCAQVTAGQGMEMDAIAACVIGGTSLMGGRAKVIGTVFGCLIVGVITNGLNIAGADTAWQVVGKGLMILGAVLIDMQATLIINRRQIKKQLKNS